MNVNRINFMTPKGLKIRLNYRYLFCRLLKPDRHYTETEITENATMQNAVSNTECLFLLPTALIQIFTIIALMTNISISTYCIATLALFLFGSLWRNIRQDFLISTTLLLFSTLYNALWWLVYSVLIVVVFVYEKMYMVLPYLIMRVSLFVISLILNHITVKLTMKKYGVPFNDSEICAFVVFHTLSGSDEPVSSFIADYVSAVCEDGDVEESKAMSHDVVAEDEQVSLSDASPESITIHTLSTRYGYYKDSIDWNEENDSFIKEWIDKDTKCIYAINDTVNGELKNITVTKEVFEAAHAKHLEREEKS